MFEKLVSLIERAVVALEKLAAGGFVPEAQPASEAPVKATRARKTAEAPTPPASEDDFLDEKPSAEPEVTYERADVKQALQEYGKKHGMPAAQALFKEASGVTALSELTVDKFAAVIEATKKPPKK
jgi:hypothetical protein